MLPRPQTTQASTSTLPGKAAVLAPQVLSNLRLMLRSGFKANSPKHSEKGGVPGGQSRLWPSNTLRASWNLVAKRTLRPMTST